ncbi:glycosyltransferase [Microbacterium sp.]|uniref:glycosyltransferase n=1 Tax=Microbacterium sp. TaxID=51671 RepID=UPI002E3368F3|nr:nucleotide disphospho-sugar-binding domain-containing protein [Microbacterium sp.]HEX5728201.1 nucleotide disphospho-sugar-binding domain-containing protein [Microbacterium sp.]
MRVLFLSANLGGNVPPTMAVALELCRRGVHVDVAGILVGTGPAATSGEDTIDVAGTATEVDASWGQHRDETGAPQPLGPTLMRIFLSRRLATEAEMLIRDRRPDVVVVDCMALALIKGANRSGLPVVVLLHTFGEYWRRTFLRGPIAAMVGALGFSPRRLWDAATLRLLLTDPVLDPARQNPELADYVWTGTTEVSGPETARGSTTNAPRVVVSFSTTSLPGMRRAYRNAIEALRDLPVEGIVTTGGFDLGHPPPAAPNVQIHGYVPHSEVLPGAALMIGHGGHSTTMKALSYGIPLLVMPLNPTADQGLIGDVVESSGLGRRISARSDPTTIRDEISALLQNPAVRARAQGTAARLRSAPPGAQVAADRILGAARR